MVIARFVNAQTQTPHFDIDGANTLVKKVDQAISATPSPREVSDVPAAAN